MYIEIELSNENENETSMFISSENSSGCEYSVRTMDDILENLREYLENNEDVSEYLQQG